MKGEPMRLVKLSAALALALPGVAVAGPLPDDGVAPREMAAVLSGAGLPAKEDATKEGNPVIRSAAGDTRFGIYFYECDGATKRCKSLQFSAGFNTKGITADDLGEWNRSKRFGRAWFDKEGEPWVEMDVVSDRGVTTEALASNLERWRIILDSFVGFLRQKK